MATLKSIWLHSVRLYIQIGLFFYYKKITLKGKHNVPKKQPILFLGNHQNALLDPLLIATKSGRFCYYLTRAAVFKKPLISRLLRSLNMLPVYRVRDGWSTITKNNSIFNKSVQLLSNNYAITIFPEGSHNIVRRVRPLSKGFTRIILEFTEKFPDQTIHLIPVGFNYENIKAKGNRVSIHFGKPILSSAYADINTVDATNLLKQDVFEAMSKLTTHIPEANYETTLQQLQDLNVDFTNPEQVNTCIKTNFKNCVSTPYNPSFIKALVKPLVYLLLCVPIIIWRTLVKPKVDEEEFMSTFRFAICLSLVPLWVLLLCIVLFYAFGLTVAGIGLGVLIVLMLVYIKS
ncbi:1-acyl-sn-glycerol-3-phosphate acyltransferase [Olleya aquimaris]|uniref:1-acyl-sn-glycerol-3-phosphate acyltransferase n=1 Tax=Olleya aquimaris TaxID=639310 RepID=A0A327RIQ9_9FLAO|nr:1-acyl-sn-glycerol-3-phosphate acyltransferase [Olleya aquimaris]RAJ16956.1 1-acyl-sn-glycerol-3-phosphate acyltransferase [Olleya aquimaris]